MSGPGKRSATLGLFAIVIALAAVVVATFYSVKVGTGEIGSEKFVGKPAPKFAAPYLPDGPVGDPNLNAKTACELKAANIFTSCQLERSGGVYLFAKLSLPSCFNEIVRLQRDWSGNQRARAIVVAFDDSRRKAALASSRLRIKTVFDDGAVAASYGVVGCPSAVAVRGGKIRAIELGSLTAVITNKLFDSIKNPSSEASGGTRG